MNAAGDRLTKKKATEIKLPRLPHFKLNMIHSFDPQSPVRWTRSHRRSERRRNKFQSTQLTRDAGFLQNDNRGQKL